MDVSNPDAFFAALNIIGKYRTSAGGQGYKGRFTQLFLGLKCFQEQVPSMYSGSTISTSVLEHLLDDLYEKSDRPLEACVLSIFENNFLPRTGIRPQPDKDKANNWRNNFRLQKGVGCYAPVPDLSSTEFLDEERKFCKYLIPGPKEGKLAGGKCRLSHTDAVYRGEEQSKWLRIDPDGRRYSIVDLRKFDNFAPYVAPDGNRVPILPLIVALYHGAQPGIPTGDRDAESITISDFYSDFNFSIAELNVYFDQDPNHPLNAELLQQFPQLEYAPLEAPHHAPRIHKPDVVEANPVAQPVIPEPFLNGTPSPPPQAHSGWDAEQFAAATLQEGGWQVHDVSRQKVGYDLMIKKGHQTRFVEVKSSLNLCAPSLTAREWQQAKAHADKYILAIVENFDPTGDQQNNIRWVKDPYSNCNVSEAKVATYTIPRQNWVSVVVALNDL